MYENVRAASAIRQRLVETAQFTVSVYLTSDEDYGMRIFVYEGLDYTLFKLAGWMQWPGPSDVTSEFAHKGFQDLCSVLKELGNAEAKGLL